jgi:hypothetical protein
MSKTKVSVACGIALALAWAGSQTGIAQGSGVFSACAGPTGQLRLVDQATACRPPETRVTWNTGGAGSLHVVDANGTNLGPFTPIGQSVVIPRPGHEGFWLVAPVVAQGFSQATSLTFSFKTACPPAGAFHDPSQRYFSAVATPAITTVLSTPAIAAGSTLYFASLDTELFEVLSQETTDLGTGVTTCASTISGFPVPSGPGITRNARVETAPVPVSLAPFKVLLK